MEKYYFNDDEPHVLDDGSWCFYVTIRGTEFLACEVYGETRDEAQYRAQAVVKGLNTYL